MIVRNQFGIILVRLAPEKTVEALEATAQGPAVVRTCRRQLISRREVPFAEGIRVVAVLQEDLREETIFERDVAVAARITGGAFGNAGHGIRVMVAAGNKTRARRRAQRGRVHVVVTQTVLREGIQVGCLAGSTEAADLAEAGVVEDNEQDIGRTFFSTQRLRPRGT